MPQPCGVVHPSPVEMASSGIRRESWGELERIDQAFPARL